MSDFPNPASVWRAVLGRLQLEMPQEHFNAFLRPCVGYEWEGGDLVVAAAGSFVVSWLELPLHLAMAEEALAETLGRNARILYRVRPDVAEVPRDTVSTLVSHPHPGPNEPEQPDDPDQCPNHPEAHLRRRTKLPGLLRQADRTGDEIFYCVGDSGHCTWVYSQQVGVFIRPGMEEQTPLDMLRAYEQARKELRERDRVPAGVK